MVNDSIANQIEIYAKKDGGWIPGGRLERMEWRGKRGLAKPGTVGRILRTLENARVLAARHEAGYVEYHYIPTDWRERYRTLHEREKSGSQGLWLSPEVVKNV